MLFFQGFNALLNVVDAFFEYAPSFRVCFYIVKTLGIGKHIVMPYRYKPSIILGCSFPYKRCYEIGFAEYFIDQHP